MAVLGRPSRPIAEAQRVPPQARRRPGVARTAAAETVTPLDQSQTAVDAGSCHDLRFGNLPRRPPGPKGFEPKDAQDANQEPAPNFLTALELGVALLPDAFQ